VPNQTHDPTLPDSVTDRPLPALRISTARRLVACVLPLAVTVFLLLAPLHAQSRNFLWKAAGKGGVVYLAGSVHMLTQDFYPLSPVLETAFKESDLLVEEVDMGEMLGAGSQLNVLTRGMLPGDSTLQNVVSPATYALVTKTVTGLGMPVEPLAKFKPWMLALTLEGLQLMKVGFDPDLGLDKHFYDLAQTGGKSVQGLETTDYQISRFDEMTMTQQDHLLAETLKALETEQASVGKLAQSWKTGDVAAVERIVLADLKNDPQLYQRLLVERNRNWLPKLEALFARKSPAFVVVGAAHLVGPDGVVAMLRAKGYSVEQR
jgi:uncharacterized protein